MEFRIRYLVALGSPEILGLQVRFSFATCATIKSLSQTPKDAAICCEHLPHTTLNSAKRAHPSRARGHRPRLRARARRSMAMPRVQIKVVLAAWRVPGGRRGVLGLGTCFGVHRPFEWQTRSWDSVFGPEAIQEESLRGAIGSVGATDPDEASTWERAPDRSSTRPIFVRACSLKK